VCVGHDYAEFVHASFSCSFLLGCMYRGEEERRKRQERWEESVNAFMEVHCLVHCVRQKAERRITQSVHASTGVYTNRKTTEQNRDGVDGKKERDSVEKRIERHHDGKGEEKLQEKKRMQRLQNSFPYLLCLCRHISFINLMHS